MVFCKRMLSSYMCCILYNGPAILPHGVVLDIAGMDHLLSEYSVSIITSDEPRLVCGRPTYIDDPSNPASRTANVS